MDLTTATTYRHPREDVLVGIERLEHLLHGAEDGTPLRLAVSNGRDADVWNLRTVLEELRAQLEEGLDRARPTGIIRPDSVDREYALDKAVQHHAGSQALPATVVETAEAFVGFIGGATDAK